MVAVSSACLLKERCEGEKERGRPEGRQQDEDAMKKRKKGAILISNLPAADWLTVVTVSCIYALFLTFLEFLLAEISYVV